MKKIAAVIVCCVYMLSAHGAWGRPVSYKGGWTAVGAADVDSYWGLVHYTPARWYSIGSRTEHFKDGWLFTGAQMNILAKRWNAPKWQANVYIKSGLGLATTTDRGNNKQDFGGFTGVACDWEDRRWFIGYENRYMYAGGIESYFDQKVRLGVAPYIADYGDIHTWLMVDLKCKLFRDKTPEYNIVPFVRFFKGPIMAEAGSSVKGDVFVTWRMLF